MHRVRDQQQPDSSLRVLAQDRALGGRVRTLPVTGPADGAVGQGGSGDSAASVSTTHSPKTALGASLVSSAQTALPRQRDSSSLPDVSPTEISLPFFSFYRLLIYTTLKFKRNVTSIILIMNSSGVNLFLLFTFPSKDCPFCKKLQLKHAKGKTGRGAQTQSVPMPAPRGPSGLTPAADQGAEATKAIAHNTLNVTALLQVPDVRLQDPRGVRADDTLVHGQIL